MLLKDKTPKADNPFSVNGQSVLVLSASQHTTQLAPSATCHASATGGSGSRSPINQLFAQVDGIRFGNLSPRDPTMGPLKTEMRAPLAVAPA